MAEKIRKRGAIRFAARAIFLVAIIAGAFYLAGNARGNELVRQAVFRYGYAGAFSISVLSGFNLAVPVPAISFLPLFLESGLNYSATIAVITLGMTIADIIAFSIGALGREALSLRRGNARFTAFLENLKSKHRWILFVFVFLFASLAPIPNEILVIPLAFLGMKLKHIILPLLLGSAVFNLVSGQGITALFNALLNAMA